MSLSGYPLESFLNSYDCELLSDTDINQTITCRNIKEFTFKFIDCDHIVTKKISSLAIKNSIKCLQCKFENEIIPRHEEMLNMKVDVKNKKITCNDCDRKYNKESLSNICSFKCLCNMKKHHDERIIYDELIKHYPDNLYRNFNNFKQEWKTYTSDLYLKFGKKYIIINIDDDSHNIKKNKDSDVQKLQILLEDNNYKSFYIRNNCLTKDKIDQTIELVLELIETDSDKAIIISNEYKTKFYHHIIKELRENNKDDYSLYKI